MDFDKINIENGWHDLRKNPRDLPPPDTYVLIAWSNYYGDNGQIVTESTLRYVLAGQFYFEPGEDESYEPGYYWHDENDDEYDGYVVAWHFLPPLFKAEK
jgi:hypothetical protein